MMDAVGVASRAHDGQQHHELQLAQVIALPHNFYNREEIDDWQPVALKFSVAAQGGRAADCGRSQGLAMSGWVARSKASSKLMWAPTAQTQLRWNESQSG